MYSPIGPGSSFSQATSAVISLIAVVSSWVARLGSKVRMRRLREVGGSTMRLITYVPPFPLRELCWGLGGDVCVNDGSLLARSMRRLYVSRLMLPPPPFYKVASSVARSHWPPQCLAS